MKSFRHQEGIALLEALIATVLLAIGLLGAIGLQARAYSALNESSMRAEATMASEKLIGIMTNNVGNEGEFVLAAGGTPKASLKVWYDETVKQIPGAVIVINVTDVAQGKQVDATITWTRKAGDKPNVHAVSTVLRTSS